MWLWNIKLWAHFKKTTVFEYKNWENAAFGPSIKISLMVCIALHIFLLQTKYLITTPIFLGICPIIFNNLKIIVLLLCTNNYVQDIWNNISKLFSHQNIYVIFPLEVVIRGQFYCTEFLFFSRGLRSNSSFLHFIMAEEKKIILVINHVRFYQSIVG